MPPVPDAFGRYQVAGPLGGRGTSFRAWDTKAFRLVAVTVPEETTPDAHRRFVDAARAATLFRHPRAVAILDVDDTGPTPFAVAEFVQGRSFADLVRTRARMQVPQILRQVADLCDAVAGVRAQGVPHRTFEPDLAMVDRDGGLKLLGIGFVDRTDAGPRADRADDDDQRLVTTIGGAAYDLLAVPAPAPATIDERHVPLAVVRPEVDRQVAALVDRACVPGAGMTLVELADHLRVHAARLTERAAPSAIPPAADPAPAVEAPRQTDRAALARRRAEQIAARLAEARAALDANDVEGGIVACEAALIIDPENDGALAILDRIRAATAPDAEAPCVQPAPAPATPVPAAAARRAPASSEAAVIELVARATGLLARVDYEGALVCLDDARAIDPGHPAVAALRGRVIDSLRWSTKAAADAGRPAAFAAPRGSTPAPGGRLSREAVIPDAERRRNSGRPWSLTSSLDPAPSPPTRPQGGIDLARIFFGVAAIGLLTFAGWAARQPPVDGPWDEAGVRSGDAVRTGRRAPETRGAPTTLTAPPPAATDAPVTAAATDAVRADEPAAPIMPAGTETGPDDAAVRTTLLAYAAAYSALDVEGVLRVFPTAGEAGLRRTFSAVRSQQVAIQPEHVEIDGDRATAVCTLIASQVLDGAPSGATPRDTRRVQFTLARRSGGWVIADRR